MVVFVSYAGALGGAERLLIDVAAGVENPIIACPPGALAEAARAAGIRTAVLRARPLRLRGGVSVALRACGNLAGHARELRRLARDLDPDLLVAWGMRTALAAGLARLDCPVAVQHNDFLPGRAPGAAVRLAFRRAALVTAPSRAVAEDLAGHGPRVQVIAPGIDVGRFSAGMPPAGSPEILVVAGALRAWKRPELALEVLARVRRAVPDARLRLAGAPLPGDPPGILTALAARAAALGIEDAVTFAGRVEDVPRALEAATLLLHCAEREPFGIAVLEALAAGRPAVVPDTGGPAETVTDTCGVRYPAGDAQAAADAVVGLLRDGERATALGAAGRVRAVRNFSLAAQRARFRAAWRTVAARRAVAEPAGDPVAVVTVTHNSARQLEALLRSVDRYLPGAHVVVADAGSEDDSVAVARARPDTVVLELANVGFGRACNRALAEVTQPVSVLLNPDVELVDDSLATLATQAATGPERLLAPLLLGSDLTRQDSAHVAPLSPGAVGFALLPPAALPDRLAAAIAPWRARHPRPVGWALGAALIGRTATLRRLGPFDERIFLLGEDLELGVRARHAGVSTWFWPSARVVHHGDHAIGPAHGGEDVVRRARARHAAVAFAYGRWGAALDDALQAFTFADRLLLKRLAGRPAGRERAQLAAVRRVSASGRRSPSRP